MEDLISEADLSELKPSELRSDELRMQKRLLAEWKENTRRERVSAAGGSQAPTSALADGEWTTDEVRWMKEDRME